VRKRTLRKKSRLIIRSTGIHKGQLLDIGSGTGGFVNEMKLQGWQVTGLEPDKDARQLAKQLYKVDLLDMDQLFQAGKERYDAITLWHVLEHVHELQSYVQQIKSLLKKEGKLFIAVPNYTSKDAAIYKEFWAAYDVPRHLYHFSPRSMAVLMEKNGLKLLQSLPMWYDSFYISLLSSKYKKGKTHFITAALNGMRSNLIALGDVQRCSSVIYIIGK
jgi:2-polyprenyl-3-methyl-5-hydroxy-6-metoxy-1,4-benzoquinol methylase